MYIPVEFYLSEASGYITGVPWTRPDSYPLKILKMKIVQGEQLFLKPDRLATLKPHCKIEKPPQYTTFKPSSNWRFYYFYFLLMYTLIAHTCAHPARKIDRTRLKSGIKSNQKKSTHNLLSFPPLFRSPLCYVPYNVSDAKWDVSCRRSILIPTNESLFWILFFFFFRATNFLFLYRFEGNYRSNKNTEHYSVDVIVRIYNSRLLKNSTILWILILINLC